MKRSRVVLMTWVWQKDVNFYVLYFPSELLSRIERGLCVLRQASTQNHVTNNLFTTIMTNFAFKEKDYKKKNKLWKIIFPVFLIALYLQDIILQRENPVVYLLFVSALFFTVPQKRAKLNTRRTNGLKISWIGAIL